MKTLADFVRPSSLAAVAACPARPTMEAAVVNAFGEPEESTEASTGTIGHALVALAIILVKQGGTWESATEAIAAHEDYQGLDKWTQWCVGLCIAFAKGLIEKYEIDLENVLVEHRLDMTDLGMAGGTADLVLVVPFKRVIVVDWKFTFLDQGHAADHDQLSTYSLAAASTFRTQEVIVYLFCPRSEKQSRATAASFDAKSLEKTAAWTRAVVTRAKAPNPELVPSYNACLYCRAFTRCAAAKESIVLANEALALIGSPTDPDEWGRLAAMAKLGEKFGDDGKEQVKAHLMKGGAATGWGLGSGRTIRSCTNPALAIQKLEAAGMGQMALEAVSLSPAKLPPEAVEVIADLVQEKPSAPSLKQMKSAA